VKRMFLILSALLALLGLALADEAYDVGEDQATVTERINLIIPQRVALHLTEDEWILDLNDPPLGNLETGEGCFLVPKGYEGTLEDAINDALNGELTPVNTYPAVIFADMPGGRKKGGGGGSKGGGGGSGDDGGSDDGSGGGGGSDGGGSGGGSGGGMPVQVVEKGTLICLNQKVLQKFCNNRDGCELDLKVTRTLGGPTYGKLGVLEQAPDINHTRFVEIIPGVNDDGDPLELLKVLGQRLPGWLDDIIIEAFWFDGTEVAGTYQFNFLFQLAAL